MKDPRSDKKPLPDFKTIINLDDWQKIQDTFAKITNVGLRTLDLDGKLLSLPSNQPKLCELMKQQSRYQMDVCGTCLPTFLGGKAAVDRNLSFLCPPGFHNFITPLRLDHSQVMAYIIMGPTILVMRRPREQYKQLAEDLDIELDVLWKAISDLRVISFNRAQTLVELIKEVGEYIIKLGFDYLNRGQETLKQAPARFHELLKVLLDLALQVSGADMGSIMLLEKGEDALTIRAAKGLSDNVIASTRVRIGEGICGTAVQDNKPLIIDDGISDNRIRNQMRRPYLKSSLILPIHINNKPFGVMNLGALEVSPIRFDAHSVESMGQLIDLATEALYLPLKQQMPDKSAYFEQLL